MISDIEASRIIGQFSGTDEHPVFVAVAGIHGNEPAGIPAIKRVLKKLASGKVNFKGQFIGLYGNKKALEKNTRFIDRDLNRKWENDLLVSLKNQAPNFSSAEDEEQVSLLSIFENLSNQSTEPIIVMDLHSTSAEGVPFCGMADTLRNRKVAFALPIPIILGLEESIDGSMLGHINNMGHVAIAFEGGQHESLFTVDCHESALWLALVAAGCITKEDIPYLMHYERLANLGKVHPRVVEIRYRHVVSQDDKFVMEPGFTNFQKVFKGQLLANDKAHAITAIETGMILMPLYQKQGEDGFFIGRKVNLFWLILSAGLRKIRFDKFVTVLPGVSPHPELDDHYIVNPKIARFFTIEIFHLLGYRKSRPEKDCLVFTRRRPDHNQ